MATKKDLSFEQAMESLEDILNKMSGEDVTMEESLALYAKAADLIAKCNGMLDSARQKAEKIGLQLEELKKNDDI